MQNKKAQRRRKIRYGIRKKIAGTADRPRLAVFRSNKQIYAQIIDDVAGHTLVAASSRELTDAKGNKTEIAKMVGTELAKKASEKGIASVAFDRGGFLYHGRIKALADGAREGGLTF
ncbi:MAG: 50S ribosomal protein L18 [Chitinophagales bacterium]|nr:50S ribosomal protein L18 [Chitinophagales bacterium]MCB9022069.1 50S ribosomal protein L18 [Chitinophagales bacterium]MCB9031798.1 50S ribosomal protein L18 [Chitinophagales bacterium]HPE96646.1 50S ribosomal protein L18 [Chitinophagales bacterium]HPR29806.1 50S ribosomal protein L18 [Chitinophagales bacterium]